MREERVDEARRFVEFLSAGRDEAAALVEELLKLPPSAWDDWLAEHPPTLQLCDMLLDAAEQDPSQALELADLVTRHAGDLPIPAEASLTRVFLRGRAWSIRARAARAAGRRDEALRAYETAASVYRAEPVAEPELAEVEREAAQLRSEEQTAGTVTSIDGLRREFTELVGRAPVEALAIADHTIVISDGLPAVDHAEEELARLRSRAWKDRAQALRALGRYAPALEALDQAETILAAVDALAHERAVVRFARALTLQDAGRFEECGALLAECLEEFGREGDARCALLCETSEGTLLYRTKRWPEAHAKWLALLPRARALGDLYTLASIHNNVGQVLVDMGEDPAAANEHLTMGALLLREAGHPLDAVRSELARGKLMVRTGEVEGGVAHLQSVREQFLDQGLVEEAGLCGLEIVDVYLARGASGEAENLARQIIGEFTAAGLNRRAIAALAYLSEAIAARRASVATVENVRAFIHTLRKDPDSEFRATA